MISSLIFLNHSGLPLPFPPPFLNAHPFPPISELVEQVERESIDVSVLMHRSGINLRYIGLVIKELKSQMGEEGFEKRGETVRGGVKGKKLLFFYF